MPVALESPVGSATGCYHAERIGSGPLKPLWRKYYLPSPEFRPLQAGRVADYKEVFYIGQMWLFERLWQISTLCLGY